MPSNQASHPVHWGQQAGAAGRAICASSAIEPGQPARPPETAGRTRRSSSATNLGHSGQPSGPSIRIHHFCHQCGRNGPAELAVRSTRAKRSSRPGQLSEPIILASCRDIRSCQDRRGRARPGHSRTRIGIRGDLRRGRGEARRGEVRPLRGGGAAKPRWNRGEAEARPNEGLASGPMLSRGVAEARPS